jgi:hypothetical protein
MTRCIVSNSDFPESLALCPICGFVPDATKLEDEVESYGQNVPDLKKYWCRKCRGHHDTISSGGTDETRVCKNCSSDDVHLVWFDITKRKFLRTGPGFCFFAAFACFSFSIFFFLLIGFQVAELIFLIFTLSFALIGRYHYKTELAFRNEWLDWAKERRFDENAENK